MTLRYTGGIVSDQFTGLNYPVQTVEYLVVAGGGGGGNGNVNGVVELADFLLQQVIQ